MAGVLGRIQKTQEVISPEVQRRREAQTMIRIAELVFDSISGSQLKRSWGSNPAHSNLLPCIYRTTPFVEVQECNFALRHYGRHDNYGLLYKLEDEKERGAALCNPDRIVQPEYSFFPNSVSERPEPITGPDAEDVFKIMRGVSEKLIGL